MKGRFYQWTSDDNDTENVHTSENPYCDNPTCWCHIDVDYHEDVTHPGVTDEEITHTYRFLDLSWGGQR